MTLTRELELLGCQTRHLVGKERKGSYRHDLIIYTGFSADTLEEEGVSEVVRKYFPQAKFCPQSGGQGSLLGYVWRSDSASTKGTGVSRRDLEYLRDIRESRALERLKGQAVMERKWGSSQ